MADDQKPKTMDIDDLVRELSKSSTSPATPTPAPQPKPSFPATAPKTMTPPPVTSMPPKPAGPTPAPITPAPKPEMPKPQFNVPPAPFNQPKPTPTPAAPFQAPGVKEYQSSIRTMNEDISKIKQGQQPMGVPVPRKVEQVIPAPQPQPQPQPMAPKPGPQFKIPSTNLGETQRTAPMVPSKDFSKPGPLMPPPPPISVRPMPMPTKPEPEQKPEIFVPQEGQTRGNRDMLFLGIGAAALVAGVAYWFFVIRAPSVIETPTPLPTPTETPTPIPTPTPTLTLIFAVPKQAISIKSANTLTSFVSDVSKVIMDPGAFKMVDAADVQTPSVSYSFVDLMTKLAVKVPAELMSNFNVDSSMFIYGQRESFDANGNLRTGVVAPNKIAMVVELKSPADASQAAARWEVTMSNDLKTLFSLGTANKNQPGFLDYNYRGVAIRYRNFAYPDKTIDYAIVTAFNGKTYMVMTNSRESILAVMDKLLK